MRVLIILAFGIFAFASNLLTYNIYERSDRVDIMLSFDAPYEGKIFQKKSEHSIVLTLESLSFEQNIDKNINSQILQKLNINPVKNNTIITLTSDKEIQINASKTIDDFGLRIRIKSPDIISKEQIKTSKNILAIPAKKEAQNSINTRYISVMAVLLALVILLFVFKKIVFSNKNSKMPMSWLFKNSSENHLVNILHQKQIDNQNKIMLLEYQSRKYLVIIGTSNILLDQFGQDSIQTKGEFEAFFDQNKQRLNDYLSKRYTPLDNYKAKITQDKND